MLCCMDTLDEVTAKVIIQEAFNKVMTWKFRLATLTNGVGSAKFCRQMGIEEGETHAELKGGHL